jgi:hypothetical protein
MIIELGNDNSDSKEFKIDLEDLRLELDSYFEMMSDFRSYDTVNILMDISSMTARASYIRTKIVTCQERPVQNFRTKELDPFIYECDRQFKIWSRLITLRNMEFDQTRGQA